MCGLVDGQLKRFSAGTSITVRVFVRIGAGLRIVHPVPLITIAGRFRYGGECAIVDCHRVGGRACAAVLVSALHRVGGGGCRGDRSRGTCRGRIRIPAIGRRTAGRQSHGAARADARRAGDGDIHRSAGRGEGRLRAVCDTFAVDRVGPHVVGRVGKQSGQRTGEFAQAAAAAYVAARDGRVTRRAPAEAALGHQCAAIRQHLAADRRGREGHSSNQCGSTQRGSFRSGSLTAEDAAHAQRIGFHHRAGQRHVTVIHDHGRIQG